MKKVAFMSVIYPGIEPFLYDFFKSLTNQSYRNFDLVILNDGFENLDLYTPSYSSKIIELKTSGSISKIREFGINHIKEEKYDLLIFGDSDDYFSENRVEICINSLENNDIVANDYHLVKDQEILSSNYLSKRFQNQQKISLEDILQKNMLGFTNTALKTSVLNHIDFDDKTVAVDWLLFTKLLTEGKTALFTNSCVTYYRQHCSNLIGMNKFNKYNIIELFKNKMYHYQMLKDRGEVFKELYQKYQKTLSQIEKDDFSLNNYFKKVCSIEDENLLWWEPLKCLEDFQ